MQKFSLIQKSHSFSHLCHQSPFKLLGAIACIGISTVSIVQPGWSQSPDQKRSLKDTQLIFNDPTPPDQGAPGGRRQGGASRDSCRKYQALTALVPANGKIVSGQTISDYPTFWFYLPDQLAPDTAMEFFLQDAKDNNLYNTQISNTAIGPGLIKISLPPTAQPLQANQPYFWTFSVSCNPKNSSEQVFVKGSIQRVQPSSTLKNQLKSATPLEQVKLLAANGVWYEAFNTLAELYQKNPTQNQVAIAWQTLLQQVGLESLTKAPFTSCCLSQPTTAPYQRR